jgi:hypothetical protein
MTQRPARNPFISTEAEDDNNYEESDGELDGATLAELEEDYEEDVDEENVDEEEAEVDRGDQSGQSQAAGPSSKGKTSLITVAYKILWLICTNNEPQIDIEN